MNVAPAESVPICRFFHSRASKAVLLTAFVWLLSKGAPHDIFVPFLQGLKIMGCAMEIDFLFFLEFGNHGTCIGFDFDFYWNVGREQNTDQEVVDIQSKDESNWPSRISRLEKSLPSGPF